MKKLLAILSIWSFLQMALATPEVIRFATEATYPPFEYMDSQGNIIGFDIDIAKAICEALKTPCTFSNEPWSSLIPGLKVGKFDALIASIAITPEREKQVLFSNPYFYDTASFIAPSAKHLTISKQGLKGKTVGVQGGTAMDYYIRGFYDNTVNVKTYASIIEAFLDMKSGRLDAVLADTPIAQSWVKQPYAAGFIIVGKPIKDPKFFGQGIGIAIRKNNVELLNLINKALAEIKANGVYDNIVNKYFKS